MPREMTHDALRMVEYLGNPILLVLADSEAGLARAKAGGESAGCRVTGAVGIEDAVARLDGQIAADAIWVEIDADHGAALDRLLDRLEAGAAAGRLRGVVAAPAGLIDIVAARTPHAGIVQLCDPNPLERAMAAGIAAARPPARLHDVGKREGPLRLQQLSEEVGRIATILATLSERDAPSSAEIDGIGGAQPELSGAAVRAMIRARRLRDQYFHANCSRTRPGTCCST